MINITLLFHLSRHSFPLNLVNNLTNTYIQNGTTITYPTELDTVYEGIL